MAIPNRSSEVKAIAAKYPQSFGPPDDTIDRRRRLLIPIIVRELNKLDGENWFLLNRLDRNDDDPRPGRLTSDVIVWGPTREHVDVLSGSGSMWEEHPVITDRNWMLESWTLWPSWDDATPAPTPAPPPPQPEPQPSFDPAPILKAIAELQARIDLMVPTIAGLGQKLQKVEEQLALLENRPTPVAELPELVAEGDTSREYGHGHHVRLIVRKA